MPPADCIRCKKQKESGCAGRQVFCRDCREAFQREKFKMCTACLTDKPFEWFSAGAARNLCSLATTCKACDRKRHADKLIIQCVTCNEPKTGMGNCKYCADCYYH